MEMDEKVKIKNEPGASSSSSAPSKPSAKPKFTPKVPVKVEQAAEPKSTVDSSASVQDKSVKESGSGDKGERKGRLQRNNERRDSRAPTTAGQAGGRGGRGQWTMPMGVSFFSGNATVQLATKARNTTLGETSQGKVEPVETEQEKAGRVSAPLPRIARPNEAIEEVITPTVPAKAVRYEDESDSDASLPDAPTRGLEEGQESWPPVHYAFNLPVQLPLGPETMAIRRALAQQPLLAPPVPQAMEEEEQTSLFVVQMPSDLQLKHILSRREGKDKKGVRLGKMLLMRSGKVQLVTEEKKIYEVSPGLAASFQQHLTHMSLPSVKAEPSSSSSAPAEGGGFYMLGNLTRKMVITPSREDYLVKKEGQEGGGRLGGTEGGGRGSREGELVEEEEGGMVDMMIDDV